MKRFLIGGLAILVFITNQSFGQISIENLRCEYLHNPIGLDEANPRFTWQLESSGMGTSLQAYSLVVGTSMEEVISGEGSVWRSGVVLQNTIPVIYKGRDLKPFTRYYWSVRVQDESGRWSDWSPPAFFETGMMTQENWKGLWITDTHDYNIKPASYFRKSFNISKKILKARAYISAAGFYELFLNGERIGNHRLDPAYTRYDRRNLYVTYDVTGNFVEGENVAGVMLGNGWYNHQSTAVWYFDKAPWRARPKFCMDIRITFED
ncbi:MAG: alpha-L-rhamnosidase N-terminal domain-containing protein, partial [Prolixibacteraceae bacterium]|nr:alpha-L-rhamnosidase N-terminal domain-containing protein [Prolixibacteraceae bacterium]